MSDHKQDEYLAPSDYLGHTKDEAGFSKFENDGSFYFSKVDGDRVVFMSQGYTSEAGRDNGVESVKKNMVLEERYEVAQYENKWYVSLKAGNRQEIAVSPLLDTKEAAMALVPGANIAASETSQSADVLKSEDKEDDYLITKEYEGHPVNDKENNVALFKHENGQYYFALYNADGSVKLRSEGFETAKNRDQELSGVLKYHNDESMYSIIQKGKYSMRVLKDKNGNEVGRSGLIKEGAGQAGAKSVATGSVAPVAAAAGAGAALVGFLGNMDIGESSSSITKVNSTKTKYHGDDRYLAMSKYNDNLGNKSMIDGDFIQFSEGGKFYFGLLDSDGKMAIRSDGYASSADRDAAIKAASTGKYNGANYSILETREGKYYVLLRDGAHNEIGRSAAFSSRAQAVAFVPETTVTYQTVGGGGGAAVGFGAMASKASSAMAAAGASSFVAKAGGPVAAATATAFKAAPVIAPVAAKAAAAAGWGLVPWAAGLLLLPLLFLLKPVPALVALSPQVVAATAPPPPVIPPPIPPPAPKVQLIGPKAGVKTSGF